MTEEEKAAPVSVSGGEAARPRRASGLLARMRIRKKLIVLHTLFSLVLAIMLWVALQPAVGRVVERAEQHEAEVAMRMLLAGGATDPSDLRTQHLLSSTGEDITVRWGTASQLGISEADEATLRAGPRSGLLRFIAPDGQPSAAAIVPASGLLLTVSARQAAARSAVVRLYVLMTVALLAVYALVAAALEVFVLPRHVYGPIRAILDADLAVADGDRGRELVPTEAMPADELGEIMRSRNRSISALRTHESALAAALARIEEVATDLKRKNHLLETARQNLADADRLASLGIMSAGLAHELNTPLTVIKGLSEKLNADESVSAGGPAGTSRRSLSSVDAALLLRVVARLERLSESLLDFARARPPSSRSNELRPLVAEAATLVRLDREAFDAAIENSVPESLSAWCDGDRIVQVLVNLLRNAIDAASPLSSTRRDPARAGVQVVVAASTAQRDGREWVSLTISDNGPGIDPDVMPFLFQPFATTRLDSRGTGLGLATSEGIVREHGGVLLARNRLDPNRRVAGAVFEVVLPTGAA